MSCPIHHAPHHIMEHTGGGVLPWNNDRIVTPLMEERTLSQWKNNTTNPPPIFTFEPNPKIDEIRPHHAPSHSAALDGPQSLLTEDVDSFPGGPPPSSVMENHGPEAPANDVASDAQATSPAASAFPEAHGQAAAGEEMGGGDHDALGTADHPPTDNGARAEEAGAAGTGRAPDARTHRVVKEMASKSHPHLVRLLGYCIDFDPSTRTMEHLLVYELMPNGDLDNRIGPGVSNPLSLRQRLDIMIGRRRTDAHPRATRRIRGRTRTRGDEAHPRTDAHPRATRRIRGRTRTRGRRGASADGRAPAGDEAHPRTDAHPRATRRIRGRTRTRGRRGASADGRAPAGDEAHPRTDAHPRATRRIRGRTRTRGRRGASADGRAPAGRRGASADGRAPAGDEAHPRTDAHLRGRRGASADGRAPAGDEAHPRTDAHPRATRRIPRTDAQPAGDEAHPRTHAHPRATRRIRGRTRTRGRRGASADARARRGRRGASADARAPRGRRGASADARAPAGDECASAEPAHPRGRGISRHAHPGRRGASADARAPAGDEAHPRTHAHPAGDEAHPRTHAHPRATRRIRGRTRTRGRRGASADARAPAGDEAHPRTHAHPRATRRIRGRTRTRGRRGASADARAPAGDEAHPRTHAHPRATRRIRGRTRTRGRRGASADARAPAGDEAHPRTHAHPRATRRIRGRTRTRGRRGASADARAPAGDEAHPRTHAHPRATRRIRGRTRTRGRRGASADARAPAGDEAHPRTHAHPRATRRIRGRTRTTSNVAAPPFHVVSSSLTALALKPVSSPPPLLLLMADDSTSIELGAIDKLELLHDTTAVNWASFEDTFHTHLGSIIIQVYCLLDVVLQHPNGLPPLLPPPLEPPPPDAPPPPEPLPDPPRAPVHDDNPDRWGANLNAYNMLRDTYTLQREAHRVAEAAHANATARLLFYAQDEKDYAEELRKIHKDVAAWRITDRRALASIFSCIPSHLKHDLRPTSSSGLWKTLSTQYGCQDLRSLLALFRKFQDITLDSSPTAVAYTRRLIDTAQRLNDRSIVISESLLTAHILDCLPPTYDTYRITFTSRYRHPPPVADTIDMR
ncbi:unnamed protein product [Closterium sp. NIES-65]|nr:unnamed protein product [Closterium sp. NIES-65]